jgi:hypothetical protein
MTAYPQFAAEALAASPVSDLVEMSEGPVVALERVARAAGATRWYGLTDPSHVSAMIGHLRAGSRVSFYFDQQLRTGPYTDAVAKELLRIAERDHGAVLGVFTPGGSPMPVDFPSGPDELADFTTTHGASATFFYGAYPGAEHDPPRTVTIDLPDADGVTRPHPH